jgi:hypothetical protein
VKRRCERYLNRAWHGSFRASGRRKCGPPHQKFVAASIFKYDCALSIYLTAIMSTEGEIISKKRKRATKPRHGRKRNKTEAEDADVEIENTLSSNAKEPVLETGTNNHENSLSTSKRKRKHKKQDQKHSKEDHIASEAAESNHELALLQENGSRAWPLSQPIGGRFISQGPVFSEDEKYVYIKRASCLITYSIVGS